MCLKVILFVRLEMILFVCWLENGIVCLFVCLKSILFVCLEVFLKTKMFVS